MINIVKFLVTLAIMVVAVAIIIALWTAAGVKTWVSVVFTIMMVVIIGRILLWYYRFIKDSYNASRNK